QEIPKATIKHLMAVMEQRGLVSPGTKLNPSTVYRCLLQNGLMKLTQAIPVDRRKFEAELPNDLWQCDCMHGPMVEHLGKRRKAYLIAFIDDYSRLVPHGSFYLSESVETFLKALEQALLTRGLPRKIYTDNGPAFRSHHLEQVTASLGVALIHSRPYKPQGRGKIERFFLTVRKDFLAGFQGQTLYELNESFDIWLNCIYHHRIHSATGENPYARFTSHMECLRPAPKDLRDHFRKAARRKVAKDRTISLNGRLFEAPVPLISKQVILLYHEDEPERVEVLLNQKSYGFLTPVDLRVNCRVKRDNNHALELSSSQAGQNYRSGGLWRKGGDTE
ncbi:MAG: DDE-type integrase/transposase/recombinase, partial [Thermodesulfobacteriota bacterium]